MWDLRISTMDESPSTFGLSRLRALQAATCVRKSAIHAPSSKRTHLRKTRARFREDIRGLAEREADQMPPELAT